MADNFAGKFLQHGKLFVIERTGRSNYDTFTGVYPQRVDIFHAGNGETVVVLVADYLELDFFPAFQRFFYKNLRRVGECVFGKSFQFFLIITESASHTTESVSRTYDQRESDRVGSLESVVHIFDGDAFRCFYFDFVQLFHEEVAIFGVHDRFDRCPEYLNIVFLQDTFVVEFGTAVECSLSTEGEQYPVGLFFFEYFFYKVRCNR